MTHLTLLNHEIYGNAVKLLGLAAITGVDGKIVENDFLIFWWQPYMPEYSSCPTNLQYLYTQLINDDTSDISTLFTVIPLSAETTDSNNDWIIRVFQQDDTNPLELESRTYTQTNDKSRFRSIQIPS